MQISHVNKDIRIMNVKINAVKPIAAILVSVSLLIGLTGCMDNGCIWQTIQDDASGQTFNAVSTTSNGNYIATGYAKANTLSDPSGALACFNSQGTLLWSTTQTDFPNTSFGGQQQDSNGNMVTVGSTKGAPALFAFDQQGNQLWCTTIQSGTTNLPAFYDGDFQTIVALSDDSFLAAGSLTSKGSEPGGSGIMAHFDKQGSLLWVKDLRSSLDAIWLDSIIETSDGCVVVSGGTSTFHAMIAKIDESGNVVWSNEDAINICTSFRLTACAGGGYEGIGTRHTYGDDDEAVLESYDANGNWLGEHVITERYFNVLNGLFEEPDGSFMFYGAYIRSGTEDTYNGFVARFDPDGNLINCYHMNYCSSICDLTLDSDGNAIACGQTSPGSGAVIMKIAASAIQS
jgi:hypothetical protein